MFFLFNLIEGAMYDCMSLVLLSKLAHEGWNYQYLLSSCSGNVEDLCN